MKQLEIDRIKKKLNINLQHYIKAIVEKYGCYISKERLSILNNIDDYSDIIKIYNYGSINAYASDNKISMPLCADKLLNIANKIPGYGIKKSHQSYNSETLINNNNTFINYMFHIFVSGSSTEDYYEDMLLHETMHFCGSGGNTALKEGINELLTRKVALEKGFRTNGCGYPKEVQIAVQLQNLFGEDILNQIAFINSDYKIFTYLMNELGSGAAELYLKVSQMMQKEFDDKYYSNMDSYNGIMGIINKTLNYHKIDYSNIKKVMQDYELFQKESKIQSTKK